MTKFKCINLSDDAYILKTDPYDWLYWLLLVHAATNINILDPIVECYVLFKMYFIMYTR